MNATHALILDDPFIALNAGKPCRERGLWPASWVTHPAAEPPFVAAFRRRFTLDRAATIPAWTCEWETVACVDR